MTGVIRHSGIMPNVSKEIRIVVGGPPHSGKSTFTDRLQRACKLELKLDIESMSYDPWDQTLLVIKGFISEEERQYRKRLTKTDADHRSQVSEFVDMSKNHTAVIGDLPGRRENIGILLDGATHAIILCDEKKSDTIKFWIQEFSQKKIPILAIISSSLDGKKEKFSNGDPIKGLLINLDKNSRQYSLAFIELGKLLRKKLQI